MSGPGCRPPWIRVRVGQSEAFQTTNGRLRAHGLHTVCEEAACPNMGHCWAQGRATLLILGDRCTRGCRFCNVDKRPVLPPDTEEPRRVAEAVRDAGLREVVITSVTRDDLPDGGAAIWAATVRAVREAMPGILIEVLVPDFGGAPDALDAVIQTRPDVFGHNIETVPRLYPHIRLQADGGSSKVLKFESSKVPASGAASCRPSSIASDCTRLPSNTDSASRHADYARSLRVLRQASDAGLITKTSLMLGLGETDEEVEAVMRDARAAGCSIFYAGQYLQPSPRHTPVVRYVEPDAFDALRDKAYALGFSFAAAAPLVRSSFHEEGQSAFCFSRRAAEAQSFFSPK